MLGLDGLNTVFVSWTFFVQVVLIIHFTIQKRLFESYTKKYDWLVYALCFTAVAISIILLINGKTWSFWLVGFLFLIWSAAGCWIDTIKGINWWKSLVRASCFPM